MSLINDALKKAQKQRTGEAPPLASMPSVGGESPQRIASRGKPAGSETLIVRAGIGGAVVLVLAVGGFFLLRDKPEGAGPASLRAGSESEASAKGSPQGRGSSSEPVPVQSSITSSPASATPAPSFTLPVAPKSDDRHQASDVSNVGGALRPDNPSTTVAKSEPPKQASLPKAVAAQPAAPAPAPAPAAERPKLEARAIEFIENIKVAGIRASATDAKVLMNDRVYRPGSMVSAEFGLKLVEITASSLTFEDDRGGRYTRTF